MEQMFLKLTNQQVLNEEEYEFYKEVACILIERYLNPHDEQVWINIEACYEEQVILLASHVHNMHSNVVASTQNSGIESISSNGRSVSFASAEAIANQVSIPQYIKDMLPLPNKPKARVRVW